MARTGTLVLVIVVLLGGCSRPAPVWHEQASALPVAAVEVPTNIRIEAIGVNTALVELGLDSAGALEAPMDYGVPGWYADGTPPGDVGPAVIAGHVDSKAGPAVFYRLTELRPGDTIQVRRGERWLAFTVVSQGRYAKDHFPTAEVYGPTPDAQLRLITCGGDFDRTVNSYRDNVVIYAILRT